MIRKITIAALMTTAIALPALAQDAQKVQPGKGPTSAIDDQVPAMKSDSPASNSTTNPSTTLQKSPSMTTPSTSAETTVAPSGIKLTDAEAKTWVGKPVYSSDQKKLGEVESIQRRPNGEVIGVNAGIGGFLGLGETHVSLLASQITFASDRVNTSVLSADAKSLPKVAQ